MLEDRPDLAVSLAGGVWIVVLALLTMAAERRRKAENVGKVFALPQAERGAEIAVSILAGGSRLWIFADGQCVEGWYQKCYVRFSPAAGVVAVLAVHGVLERLLENPFQSIGRRKRTDGVGDCSCSLVYLCHSWGIPVDMTKLPKDEEVGRLKIALSGWRWMKIHIGARVMM